MCRFLLYELLIYCLWLASYSCFTLLFQTEDPVPLFELLGMPGGVVKVAANLISVTAMIPFLYMEVCMKHTHSSELTKKDQEVLCGAL